MKNIKSITKVVGAVLMGWMSFTATLALAQTEQIVTTTTSSGTISEFNPDTIVIKTETSPEPIRYTYTKTTTYVDENGAPVSIETVKSGLPVTVYYVKEGDRMVASKVVVKKAVIEQQKTTTTTTTTTDKDKDKDK